MSLFRKRSANTSQQQIGEAQETRAKIEVVAHKEATKKQVAEVKEVNRMLNKQFAENGFTIKIYLAAGGRTPKKVGH